MGTWAHEGADVRDLNRGRAMSGREEERKEGQRGERQRKEECEEQLFASHENPLRDAGTV